MNPKFLVGGSIFAAALVNSGLFHNDGLSPEQRQILRAERERREAAAVAAKRAASPDVAAAEAKRLRKAEKLRKLTQGTQP